jgi:hypothetical protein
MKNVRWPLLLSLLTQHARETVRIAFDIWCNINGKGGSAKERRCPVRRPLAGSVHHEKARNVNALSLLWDTVHCVLGSISWNLTGMVEEMGRRLCA